MREVVDVINAPSFVSVSEGLDDIYTSMKQWFSSREIAFDNIIRSRVYLTDPANQLEVVRSHALYTDVLSRGAFSYVGQPLLNGAKVAVMFVVDLDSKAVKRGSPDKMIIGLNCKFICTNHLTLYGQLMFNEFRLSELLSSKGWYGNKYAFQVGMKSYDIFKINGLDFQFEYNHIRPFVYSQYDALGCYTHQKQSVGHPLGANLKEGLAIVNYRHGRFAARLQANVIAYGDDIPGDSVSYGHNPERRSTLRNSAYGIHMLQGLKTDVHYFDCSGSFIINPRNMMNLTAGVRIRKRSSDLADEVSKNFYMALRWSIKSRYYDY